MHPILFEFNKLIFAELCGVCSKPLQYSEQELCITCTNELPLIGDYKRDNVVEKIFWGKLQFNFAHALMYVQHGNKAHYLIHQLKYKSNKDIGIWLGQQLGIQVEQLINPIQQTILLPVPLNNKKLHQRGFNQSQILAEGMVISLPNVTIASKELLRIKHTETQTNKNRSQRFDNMEHAFEVKDTHLLENKHIILVDDVITTGATIYACATALQKIPGVTISIAAVGLAIGDM